MSPPRPWGKGDRYRYLSPIGRKSKTLDPARHVYLVAVGGAVEVNGHLAEPRDGVAITGEDKLKIKAVEDAEIVLVDAR